MSEATVAYASANSLRKQLISLSDGGAPKTRATRSVKGFSSEADGLK